MSKVCILIPYYGKWPSYFPLFLKSCSYNPIVDILFFTDIQPPEQYPANVHFHHFTFSKIKIALDDLLGFKTQLTTAYKLCDVRPAYGLIFKEYIRAYVFWGWGDIDLIYGKVGDYMNNELLSTFDVISMREKWLSGSFCLIRNSDLLNNLFLQTNDKEEIFSSPDYKGFDEISRCWTEIRIKPFDTIDFPNDNFTRLVLAAKSAGQIRVRFANAIKESIPEKDYLIWEKGVLSDNHGNRYSHYHFITEKRRPYFYCPDAEEVEHKYFIDQAGFYSEEEFKIRKTIRAKRVALAFPGMAIENFKKLFAVRSFGSLKSKLFRTYASE